MNAIISIDGLSKTYATGLQALREVSLEVRAGEILALLGPNGAGKTTLISIVCGLVTPSAGRVRVGGHDIIEEYRAARALIGLVPQELKTEPFETVWDTVVFSRGLFGRAPDPALIEQTLRDLSLWEKRDQRIMTLSGGMKRRVMIAKALAHEPRILFLDEPTAGVDVELRQGMWRLVERLRENGVTIILTTHYLEEAEEIADRVGIIDKGELALVEETQSLMRRLGRKRLTVELAAPLATAPPELTALGARLSEDGRALHYAYDRTETSGVAELLTALQRAGVAFRDVDTEQSSLEEIFVDLVRGRADTEAPPSAAAPEEALS